MARLKDKNSRMFLGLTYLFLLTISSSMFSAIYTKLLILKLLMYCVSLLGEIILWFNMFH
jgi:hypothetical protein